MAYGPVSLGGYQVLIPATENELGGVKVGNGLIVTDDGTLSVNIITDKTLTKSNVPADAFAVKEKLDSKLGLSGGVVVGDIILDENAKVVGDLNGTASVATKAVQDGNGNIITSSYPMIYANAGFHNSIYRGKDITSKFNDGSLFVNISNGTFNDLYIGDYFTKTCGDVTTNFRLAGFDIYYRCGDAALAKHHAVIVPDKVLTTANMNASTTVTGGYVGSRMYTGTIPDLNAKLEAMVGSEHLIKYRDLLSIEVNDSVVSGGYGGWKGASSNWEWKDTKCRLMNEVDVYGTVINSSSRYDVGLANVQLPLFALNPSLRIEASRRWWWLSSVAGLSIFCAVSPSGDGAYHGASVADGVRPRFLIG